MSFPYLASASGPLPISLDPGHIDVTASPGEHLEKSFNFWNGTGAYLPLHLQPEDFATQGEEGVVNVGGEEDAANSLKNWIKPEYPDIEVAPKQQITLNFSIDVPTNADPGDHWGTLVAFAMPQGGGAGVGINAGLGFIIYVRVRGDAYEKLTIESLSVPRFADSASIPIEARFHNKGTVHQAPQGFIEVRNVFGSLVATGTLPVRNVLPSDIRKVDTQVGGDGLWWGRYTVLLDVTYGNKGEKIEASAQVWIVPWKQYGLWVLVVVALLALLVWRRKRLPAFWYVLKNGVPPPTIK